MLPLITILLIVTISVFMLIAYRNKKQAIILEQKNISLQGINDTLTKSLAESKQTNIELVDRNNTLTLQLGKTETENKNLEHTLEELKNRIDDERRQMMIQFQNVATSILEEKTKKFTEQNQINMDNILKPLSERIQMFEKQIETSNKNNIDQTSALRVQIGQLYALNAKMTKEAENLSNAIRGNAKIQGNWGEFILEKILESSGLEKDREYSIQKSFTTDEGKRFQPDIIINLPSQKHIIIDSKLSLNNYEQYFNAEDGDTKNDQLKKHLTSIKRHIMMLSNKNYQSQFDANGLDFVLMFIPIEQAYMLVIQNEQSIFAEAYDRNIIIVSPSTLIATLRIISNVWRNEYQNQNAMEIAQQSGALYDKFVSFIDDLKQIGKQIDSTKNSYYEATKKLYEGNGNIVKRIEKIKSLGAKASKSLDANLISRSNQT